MLSLCLNAASIYARESYLSWAVDLITSTTFKDLTIKAQFGCYVRNPNKPTPLGVAWPQYTASKEEYLGFSPNLTVRSKMRPDKMALWNELLPSIEETIKPTTTSHIPTTSDQTKDKKGM